MQKYSCLIVEDEPLAAEILEDYIGLVPFLDLKGVCPDALFAMEKLKAEKIDLLFLDIHLPVLQGIDFLKTLKQAPPVIITSAYPQYALNGFDLDVLDYLLKPVEFNRFLKAVNKLKLQKEENAPLALYNPGERGFHYFNVNRKYVKIYFDEILFVESLREYVKITTSDKSILTKIQLNEVESLLSPGDFIRIHRSFLVAREKIDAFTAAEIEIRGKQLPIGRTYKDGVLTLLESENLKRER